MNSPILVRPAAPQDAAAACLVLRRSILELCVRDHQHDPALLENWLGNKEPATVAAWFSSSANYCVVAERDGQVVGVSLMTLAGKLSLCYVLPEALHSGVGKAMLSHLEAKARELGIGIIRMHCTASALDFFTRHGYIAAGREKACFGLDTDFLWKKLNAVEGDCSKAGQRFCPCSPP
ncbi:GNAT family N-acetyltransferase [Massilia sp. TS11]|uniref:GNAT family N-acetyltransferase n=1 Tax=Massilia sp. TS11 TaxID=2908003 RepID=UPI001EDB1D17|nr:GNAT family N-acetyltransferase [Massilia sp. TS11]MCG2584019.1 GNAT family N-acetyltransferase [Massilia sp. TS11]